jgi:hypothetical protein
MLFAISVNVIIWLKVLRFIKWTIYMAFLQQAIVQKAKMFYECYHGIAYSLIIVGFHLEAITVL